MWTVPLKCSFTWQCSSGTSMTDIVISHRIMGMTLLSYSWVTSRFRLPKHMSYQLFFSIWCYLFIRLFSWVHKRTQIHKVRSFFRRAVINIYSLAESINTNGQPKNQCMPATYFNLLMKVTLFQQRLRGRRARAHTHTHTQTKSASSFCFHATLTLPQLN